MRKPQVIAIIAGVLVMLAIGLGALFSNDTLIKENLAQKRELSTLPARAPNGQFTERK